MVPDADVRARSIALRVAHDLFCYHRLDSEILSASEAENLMIQDHQAPQGNIVYIGTPKTAFVRQILDPGRLTFTLSSHDQLLLREEPITGVGLGN